MKTAITVFMFILLFSGAATLVNGQTKSSSAKRTGKAEITDLILYDIMLYDTAVVDTRGDKAGRYLSEEQSSNFRKEMSNLLMRKDLVYFDGNNLMTQQKVIERTTVLKSLEDIDSLGNVIGFRTVADTIDMEKWSMVTFYEEWKLNRSNGMIEKNVLGYVFHWYNEDKGFWIPLFGIAQEKSAQEKIKKLIGW